MQTHPAKAAKGPVVAASEIEGAVVYGLDGERIGHVDHLMLDRETGHVAYAVLGFGGILGLGEEHYPVPWRKLGWDEARGGFVADLSREALEATPRRSDEAARERHWERSLYNHYGVPPYWL